MKSELDTLMQERSLDALLVSGGTHENPCMYYLANGAKVGASTLAIKQRGREPVLIVVGMEREDSTQLGTTRTNIVMFLALCCRSKKHGARPNEPHLLMAPPPTRVIPTAIKRTKYIFDASVIDGQSTVGGGSLPGETLPTKLVAVRHRSPKAQAARLRSQGIVARVQESQLLLDPRTVGDWSKLMQQGAEILTNLRSAQ